jgi:hypothetical protein
VYAKARYPGDSRIFDSGVVGAAFPSLVRGQDDSSSLDTDGNPVAQDDLR